MKISINTINAVTDKPACISTTGIQGVTQKEIPLQKLKEHIIEGWLPSHDKNMLKDGTILDI